MHGFVNNAVHQVSQRVPAFAEKIGVSGGQSLQIENWKSRPAGPVALLIDDESIVVDTCRSLLERLDWRVLTADSGRAAQAQVAQRGGSISAVFLDMNLPDTDGPRLFVKLRRVCPGLSVIICSGCDRDETVDRLLERGAVAFLQKPFGIQSLKAALVLV